MGHMQEDIGKGTLKRGHRHMANSCMQPVAATERFFCSLVASIMGYAHAVVAVLIEKLGRGGIGGRGVGKG